MKTMHKFPALRTVPLLCFAAVALSFTAGCHHLQHLQRLNPPPAPDFRVHYPRFDTQPKPDAAERLAEFAKETPLEGSVHYEVVGHAYDRKGSGSNFAMGKRRAEIVQDLLIEAGIPAERINARTVGDTRPSIAYHNFGRRAKFNRVEIYRIVSEE